jgi:hypothetical protein
LHGCKTVVQKCRVQVCTDNKKKYSEKTVEQTVVCHFIYRGRTHRNSHIREHLYTFTFSLPLPLRTFSLPLSYPFPSLFPILSLSLTNDFSPVPLQNQIQHLKYSTRNVWYNLVLWILFLSVIHTKHLLVISACSYIYSPQSFIIVLHLNLKVRTQARTFWAELVFLYIIRN